MIEMDSKKIHENIDFVELKKIYKEGQNVTQYLAQKFSLANIDAEIIKYAYDLQAGSYTDFYTKNNSLWEEIGLERAEILRKFGDSPSSLLDGGTGEATTLTAILNNFSGKPQTIHAFDISFSRLLFAQAFLKRGRFDGSAVKLAVADLRKIPYAYNSFDLVITTEAIEPNGGYVEEIISELFRVARQRIIMIEPYYERSSLEARARMDQHKYVKNLPKVIEKLGGGKFWRPRNLKLTSIPLTLIGHLLLFRHKKIEVLHRSKILQPDPRITSVQFQQPLCVEWARCFIVTPPVWLTRLSMRLLCWIEAISFPPMHFLFSSNQRIRLKSCQ